MLIEKISPIIQVTYARGGKLKYSKHTICFPQDISSLAIHLPKHIKDLDMLIVNKNNIKNEEYNFHVSRSHVIEALKYKITNDPYYKYVTINEVTLAMLPETF